MKSNHKRKSDSYSRSSSAISLGSVLLAPTLFQIPESSSQLLIWLLVAIAVAIGLLFVLIAFILLPMSRRAARKAKKKQAAQEETLATPKTPPPTEAIEDTEAETVPIDQIQKETVLSIPKISTVGQPITLPIMGERPATIGWHIAGLSDVGLKREINEDNLVMIEDEMTGVGPYGIYVVADGLGGHEAGEVASQLTIDTVKDRYLQAPPTASDAPFESWFQDTITQANETVINHQTNTPATEKMGSTLIMSLLVDNHAYIANVGDSRAYHLTDEAIEQVSVDHSLVERLVQIGQITREEARDHPKKNVVYSIIGEAKKRVEIGYHHTMLNPGDRLLLCSDGLTTMLSDEEVLQISKHQPDPIKAVQLMVETAKQAGGFDNITVVIVQMN